jgi:hypothetical protein
VLDSLQRSFCIGNYRLTDIPALLKGKTIPVTGCGGPWCCETSSLPHFLEYRLTDDGEVVSLTSRPPFTRRKIHSTNFYYRLSRHHDHSAAGRIRSIEKSNRQSILMIRRSFQQWYCSRRKSLRQLPR